MQSKIVEEVNSLALDPGMIYVDLDDTWSRCQHVIRWPTAGRLGETTTHECGAVSGYTVMRWGSLSERWLVVHLCDSCLRDTLRRTPRSQVVWQNDTMLPGWDGEQPGLGQNGRQ